MRQISKGAIGVSFIVLLTMMLGSVGASATPPACISSNATVNTLCQYVAQLQAQVYNLTNNQSTIRLAVNALQSNSIMAWNAIYSNENALNGNIITLNTDFNGISNTVNTLALNDINASTANTLVSRVQNNLTSGLNLVNANITKVNRNVSNAVSIANTANAKENGASSNASTALSRSSQALALATGVQNTSKQEADTINGNVSTLERTLYPITGLNLTGNSNKFSTGISTSDDLVIIAIAITIIGLFITNRRISNLQKKPPKDIAKEVIGEEAQVKVAGSVKAKEKAQAATALQSDKESAEVAAQRARMKADPQFEKLRKEFLAERKAIEKHKLKVDITALESYKALSAKMAEYGETIKL